MGMVPGYHVEAQNRRMFIGYALADAQAARGDAERSGDGSEPGISCNCEHGRMRGREACCSHAKAAALKVCERKR